MLRSRTTFAALTFLMIASMLLGACAQPASTPAPAAPAAQAPAQAPAQPTEAPKPSILVYGQGGDAVMLDPANVTDGFSLKITRQIYDTLVEFKDDTFELVPALATEWSNSADGKEWTFKLRQGVKFHDGTPWNAEAAKFNFDRWMYTKNPYHIGAFEYWKSMWGGYKDQEVKDANGNVTGTEDKSTITDVTIVDEYTIKLTLTKPVAPFLLNIAMPAFAFASPEAVKKAGEAYGTPAGGAVGTGPFVYKDWVKDDRVTLTANPDYFMGKPGVDQVVVRAIKDNSARLAALKAGEIMVADNLGPDDMAPIRADSNLTVVMRPAFNIAYLAFNNETPPFDNVKVRQAFAHAINKQAIVDGLYGGTAVVANQFMPPSIALGYHKELKEAYPYDTAKAKQLLAEAGFPDGLETDLWYMPVSRPYYPTPQKVAEAFAADLADAGIKVNLKTQDWSAYLADRGQGKLPVYMLGWTGDNGDPDNFLYVFFGKKTPGYGNYGNTQVHQILADAQANTDPAVREKLYKQAAELIQADSPFIPIAHANPPLGASVRVQNFKPHPTGGESWFKVTVK